MVLFVAKEIRHFAFFHLPVQSFSITNPYLLSCNSANIFSPFLSSYWRIMGKILTIIMSSWRNWSNSDRWVLQCIQGILLIDTCLHWKSIRVALPVEQQVDEKFMVIPFLHSLHFLTFLECCERHTRLWGLQYLKEVLRAATLSSESCTSGIGAGSCHPYLLVRAPNQPSYFHLVYFLLLPLTLFFP